MESDTLAIKTNLARHDSTRAMPSVLQQSEQKRRLA
jgi:hypothetical protein